jgi:dGTPase
MINTLVMDLILETEKNLRQYAPGHLDDVRRAPPIVAFSAKLTEQSSDLKAFLRTHLYRHYRVMRMSAKARRIIIDLFRAFSEDSRLLPQQFRQQAEAYGPRSIADYIAGMTDRYAIREYRRIFTVDESLV